MRIRINGEWREFPAGASVDDLLAGLGLDGAIVAVEVNLEVVPRGARSGRVLKDGDEVEIVSFVGGG
jgi:sulfur carrier protein